MHPYYTHARAVAEYLAVLTRKAPAGGIFTHAIVSEPAQVHRVSETGEAYGPARFVIATPEGEVEVTVTPLLP